MKEQKRCPLGVKFIRTGASIALAAAMVPTTALASENDPESYADMLNTAIESGQEYTSAAASNAFNANALEASDTTESDLASIPVPESITPIYEAQTNTFRVSDHTKTGYSFTLAEPSMIQLSVIVSGRAKSSSAEIFGLGVIYLVDENGVEWDEYRVSKTGLDETGLMILPKGKYTLIYDAAGTETTGSRSLGICYASSADTGIGLLSDLNYAKTPNRSFASAAPISLNKYIFGSIYWANWYTWYGEYSDVHYYKFTLDKAAAPTVALVSKGFLQVAIVDSNNNVVRNNGKRLEAWINNDEGKVAQFKCGELEPGTYTVLIRGGEERTWNTSFLSIVDEFYDVLHTKWYAPGVYFCSDKGLLSGYTDANGKLTGQFGTGDTLTRAQLAAILWRNAEPEAAAAYNADQNNTTGMADVESRAWYTGAANWAVKNGVINGFDGKEFRPNDPVTTEQFVTILANYVNPQGAEQADQSTLNSFADAGSISSWARGSVAWAKKCEIINGYEENGQRVLKPSENVARERAATILMNSFDSGVLK